MIIARRWVVGRALIFCSALMLFFLSLIELGHAQTTPVKPILKIRNSEFDFGVVPSGSVVSHNFVVKNDGQADLVIQRVVAACGCTAALPPNGSIAPGTEAIIPVTFDTSGFSGKTEKPVRVFSNDIDNPTPVLYLRGTIDTQVQFTPTRIRFDEVSQGAFVAPQEVSIVVNPSSSLSISGVESISPNLKLSVPEKTAKKARILVSLGEELKTGPLRERIVVVLKDSSGKEQAMNIPVVGSVRGPIEVQPKVISLGVIEGEQPIIRSVKINTRAKEPLVIESFSSNSPLLQASLREIKKGDSYVLSISVDPKSISADIRSSVRIKTNYKAQPEIILDVYGIVPPQK